MSYQSKPKITAINVVAKTRLFTIESLTIVFANGQQREYERLAGGAPDRAVMVVPMLNNDTVLMIKEYAAGLDNYQITLPKGAVDPGETPIQAANRELMEEVGYAAKTWSLLKIVSLSPSYMSHCMTIFLAQDLYPKRLPGDEPEPLEVVPYALAQLDEFALSENITEARAIAALYLAKARLGNAPHP